MPAPPIQLSPASGRKSNRTLREFHVKTIPTVAGIDYICITVSDLIRSEIFYDIVLLQLLEFRKNKFALDGEPHIQFPLFSVNRAVLALRDQPFA